MPEVKKSCLSSVWRCPRTPPLPSRDAPPWLIPDSIRAAASAWGTKVHLSRPWPLQLATAVQPQPPTRWLTTTAICNCSQFRGLTDVAPFLALPRISWVVGFGRQNGWKGQGKFVVGWPNGGSSPPLHLPKPSQAPEHGGRWREGRGRKHPGALTGKSQAATSAHGLVKASLLPIPESRRTDSTSSWEDSQSHPERQVYPEGRNLWPGFFK